MSSLVLFSKECRFSSFTYPEDSTSCCTISQHVFSLYQHYYLIPRKISRSSRYRTHVFSDGFLIHMSVGLGTRDLQTHCILYLYKDVKPEGTEMIYKPDTELATGWGPSVRKQCQRLHGYTSWIYVLYILTPIKRY